MNHALVNHHRTFQPVRRDSFDVDDPRAQVFRPIEHGLDFVDAYLKVFDEWDDLTKKRGERHAMGGNCRKVLRTILRRCIDYKTGLCEPSLDTLARLTRFAKPTVVRCLKLLWSAGFVDWVRRTERTDLAPGEGPQVRQVTNAYYFDVARLPERCLKRLKEILRRAGKAFRPPVPGGLNLYRGLRERRASRLSRKRADLATALSGARSAEETARLLYPSDELAQAAYLAMLEGKGASSAVGLNPSSRMKIQKE